MKKILVIQTASIGDVILMTPVVEKLHVFYPEAKLDILIKKGNEKIRVRLIVQCVLWSEKYGNFRT